MIVEIRAKNIFAFNEEVVFSANADMRAKKFSANVYQEESFNILKVLSIYGPNNVGKTCLIKVIGALRNLFLNKKNHIQPNLFTGNLICELGVTFLHDHKEYDYTVHFDCESQSIIYERFEEIIIDEYNNKKSELYILKDIQNNTFICKDNSVESIMPVVSNHSLLCHTIDASKFDIIQTIKTTIIEFANRIDIVNMNNIPLQRTIELLKNKNNIQQKVVNFIKQSDLYLDDYRYDANELINFNSKQDIKADEKVLDIPEQIIDQLKLVSVYKGIPVPSMLFDSTGTKKIAALASYIIEALENGRILIIDELDSSIHFMLTRSIVALFNNELNQTAQLIFTLHDVNLLDCKRLFRKEQIWFIHKDNERVYLYSLANFTAADDGIRDTTNIIEKYKKGLLGALPDPNLINTLLDIKGEN
ncbi:AAA family ATPase [Veillonella caviae]|uniref:AAA family ATPase n=1 Tax=Veillonella caviae TaxID=248316 RepID=UPI002357CA57|nr:ATP-binding protein [Veillonella caviae]